VGRPPGLLVLAELAELACGERLMAAGGGPSTAELVIGDHGDRRIIGAVHVGLEEQWRLDDADRRRRPAGENVGAEGDDSLGDERPEQSLEPDPLGRIGKHPAGDRGPVDGRVANDVLAPAGPEGRADTRRPVQLVDDRVGREGRRPEPFEQAQDG
jgi:hypothetical protein